MDTNKVLRPYEKETEANVTSYAHTLYLRKRLSLQGFPPAIVYKGLHDGLWRYDILNTIENFKSFPTSDEAMAICDQQLLQLGYTLLTQEQYEKLLVLI